MKTAWNLLFPLSLFTVGTFNSIRPAIVTIGNQTWAVGLYSLKALKQTTKIPKYSWYGLQLLFGAPLKLMKSRNGNKSKKLKKPGRSAKRTRNGYSYTRIESGDAEEDGDVNISVDAAHGTAASVSDTSLEGRRRRRCLLVFRRPTQTSFVTVYRTIPLRLLSRVWGRLMAVRLPKMLRKPVIYIYATVYGCNLKEISMDDLSAYTCIGEFFRRRLRPEVRPVDADALVTSPADGTLLKSGVVDGASLEQIKGVSYSLRDFLGPKSWSPPAITAESSTDHLTLAEDASSTVVPESLQEADEAVQLKENLVDIECADGAVQLKQSLVDIERTDESGDIGAQMEVDKEMQYAVATLPLHPAMSSDTAFHQQLLTRDPSTHRLHHLVVYLAPGDYHRFHSPANWTITFRRHFPGDLFSVAPLISRMISGLFNYNERVMYAGTWEHGFFSMTAVGATGVGSIRTGIDPLLATNRYSWNPRKANHEDLDFIKEFPEGIKMSKGDEFGEFNLGSTIVLIFEAPKDFKLELNEGSKVKVGQGLGFPAKDEVIPEQVEEFKASAETFFATDAVVEPVAATNGPTLSSQALEEPDNYTDVDHLVMMGSKANLLKSSGL